MQHFILPIGTIIASHSDPSKRHHVAHCFLRDDDDAHDVVCHLQPCRPSLVEDDVIAAPTTVVEGDDGVRPSSCHSCGQR